MESLWRDLRHAFRLLSRSPGYTGPAVATLAVGIGAAVAIFSALDAVVLRPLPCRDESGLVMIWSRNTKEGIDRYPVSPGALLDVKSQGRSFDRVEGMYSFLTAVTLAGADGSERLEAATVTPGIFALLGRDAELGRTFAESDTGEIALVSHELWQRRFGGDPAIVGRAVTLDGRTGTVVGVMPADFEFPYRTMLGPSGFLAEHRVDVWLPLSLEGPRMKDAAGHGNRRQNFLSVVARLAPGVDLGHARAEMDVIAKRMADANPATDGALGATVVPLHEQVTGQARPALGLLLACVGVVLAIACANVANLMLARSLARTKEMAVRAALGASRGALVRQTLAEGLALGVCGGAAGLLIGQWGLSVLLSLAPAAVPRLGEAVIGSPIVLFAAALSIATGVVIGLLPGVTMARRDLMEALRASGRALTTVRSGHRARAFLVAGEVALGVVLCCAAGLLVRSLVQVLAVDPGFRAENLLTLQISLPNVYSDPSRRVTYYQELFGKLTALPGVIAAGGTTRIPLGSTNVGTAVVIEGRPAADRPPEVEFRRAVGDYFATMEIPILRGRDFGPGDSLDSPGVVLVNETMARRLWPGGDPLGARVKIGPDPNGPWMTVVGIAGDVRHETLEADPSPELYISGRQGPPSSPFLAVRSTSDAAALTASVRETVRALDPAVAVYDIRPMEQVRAASVASRRFLMLLVVLFGATALGLAALGVYGLTGLIVTERTQEMGIRLALGARPAQLLGLVLSQGMRLAGTGAAVGVAASLAVGPALAGQLYGVGSRDLVTMIGAPLVLMAAVLAGSFFPARRATRVDPMRALREE